MARFSIYSANGSTVRYSGAPVYHGSHLRPAYLEFREIASPTKISWQIGDYVDYGRTGFRYKLYSLPYPTKQAVANAAGDSFVYRDVQFFCASKDLEIAPFRDLVISDNQIHFTTLPDVSTYEDVYGVARRIQANMDSFYGEGAWVIRVFDTSDSDLRALMLETKEFSLSDGTCLDALSQIYSQWKGIGWMYSVENGVNTITIGRPNVQDRDNTTNIFAYGIGNGLTLIKKEQSQKNDLATRIYAYGSTRNIIARYYNNLTPAIKDAESVYIPNLMIPLSEWGETDSKKDARKAFLEASGDIVGKYGLRPKTIYFDGSGDYEEIYPSLEGMTAGQLRAAMQPTDYYYPSLTFAADNQRLDEVALAENPTDDGVISAEGGGRYIQTVNLLGVSQSHTYNFAKGQESAKIPLTGIVVANTISETGKVRVTPSFVAAIESTVNIGTLSVRLWLEIGGVKYGNIGGKIVRGVGNSYTVTVEPFDINTENGGEVILTGYIFAVPTNKDGSSLTYALNMGTTTLEVETVLKDSFKVHIRQIGFDISKQQSAISDGLCTIAFKTGWCAGREFTVKKCEYQESNDRWVLTVVRHNDESLSQYFPNSIYRIEAGDRFVLTDLTMPEVYITSASERLLARAQEVLTALSTPKIIYEPQIDAKVLARSPELLLEGMYMPIQDDDIIEDTVNIRGVDYHREWVMIDTLEIDESDEAIPTYKVTLQDEKRESFLSKISQQTGHNTRNISEIELRDLRNDVEELTPSTSEPEEISVNVVASHPIIGYETSFDDEPINEVTLTCQTTGIDNPSYQWYYLGAITWVAITGATGQSYVVDPDSLQYYRNGEIVEDFRCVVNGNPDLAASVQIMKVLANAVSVSLSNPAHIFAAGVQYAEAATDRTDILGYKGVERFATKVKMSGIRFLDSARSELLAGYTGGRLKDSQGRDLTDSQGRYLTVATGSGANLIDTITGEVIMTVEVVNNNTTSTYLNITTIEDKMNIPAGVIEIPIVIREADASAGVTEKVVNLYYSWSLALQGNTSFTSVVFTRTTGTPEAIADDDGDFDNPVPQNTYTDSAHNSYTWSDGIPSGDATLWMSMRIFSANGYYPQEEHWSTPSPAFDTADIDFEYSALETNPGTPSNPATGANWHNTATQNDIWMAMRKKSGGVWGAWEVFKVKGEKGDSPLFADIDNEMDGLTVGPDGILQVSGGVTLTTKVSMWYGDTAQTITGIVASINHLSSNIHVTYPNGVSTGEVRIQVDNNTNFNTYDKIAITLLVTCALGSRSVVYTLLAIKDGEDGVVYKLIPDYDVVKGAYNSSNQLVYTPTAVKVTRYKRKGSGEMATSTEGEIRYSVDGGTTIQNNYNASTGVSVSSAAAAGKIIFYWYINNVMVDRETIPIVADGENGQDGTNGYSASTIYLYKRSSNGAPTTAPGNSVYTFATGVLAAAEGASLNGWQQTIPTGDDPCYVTMFFAQDNQATQSIPGGWVSAGGSWAAPTRLTGDNGLMGKVMRGINEFSSTYGAGVKTQTLVEYQGLSDTDTSHIYYDMVYREVSGTRTYYYCKVGGSAARSYIPGSTTGWETYWSVATQFDFIATRVLLASNAFIDILSGNGVYVYDTGQNYIVAGVQGGSGVNFFAGTQFTEDGTTQTVTPASAPFRVNYDGSVYASNMTIEGGKVLVNAQIEQLDGNRISIKTNYGIRGKYFMLVEGSGQSLKQMHINGDLGNVLVPLMSLTTAGGYVALSVAGGATVLTGDLNLSDSKDNKIGTEYITSSPSGKHWVVCEHGQVPAVGNRDANTLYFEKAS